MSAHQPLTGALGKENSKRNRFPLFEPLEDRRLLSGTFNGTVAFIPAAEVTFYYNGSTRTVPADAFNVTRSVANPGDYAGIVAPGESFTAFCIDLVQGVVNGQTTEFTITDLAAAPDPGPTMSAQQALRLRELYGRFSAGVGTDPARIAAFQLAVWEVSNDTDANVTTGPVRLVGDNDPAIVAQAQGYVDALNGQGPLATLLVLDSPIRQDLIFEVPGTTPAYLPASLSGHVYQDLDNNGLFETSQGDKPIAGATVTLSGTDINGAPVSQTAATDDQGFYAFTGLQPAGPGGYTLTETQPAGYDDGKDTIGSQGGTTGNDVFSSIPLVSGQSGVDNNFGEVLSGGICTPTPTAYAATPAPAPAPAPKAVKAKPHKVYKPVHKVHKPAHKAAAPKPARGH